MEPNHHNYQMSFAPTDLPVGVCVAVSWPNWGFGWPDAKIASIAQPLVCVSVGAAQSWRRLKALKASARNCTLKLSEIFRM